MELTVLGSGSSGNCYVIQNSGEAIIIEAGVRFADVKRVLGYDLRKVAACLVSHEHGDHAGCVADIVESCVPTYASEGTWSALGISSSFARTCRHGAAFACGGFRVMPFGTNHDAAQPLGFLINHQETGTILFATDTYYLPCTFDDLSQVMIECNYVGGVLRDNIRSGAVDGNVARRVRRSHMELGTCIEALKANDLRRVRNIILLHVSRNNGDPEYMRRKVIEATGKTVHVASRGLVININKEAF